LTQNEIDNDAEHSTDCCGKSSAHQRHGIVSPAIGNLFFQGNMLAALNSCLNFAVFLSHFTKDALDEQGPAGNDNDGNMRRIGQDVVAEVMQ
jgi:hypothetical protein